MKEKLIRMFFKCNSNLSMKEIVCYNNELFNMNIYTNAFNTTAPTKGENLFYNSEINEVCDENSHNFKLKTKDNEEYNITIEFEDDGIDLLDAQCDCNNFIKSGISCEHIYACLYKNKALQNNIKLKEMINTTKKDIMKLNNFVINFVDKNIKLIEKISNFGDKYIIDILENSNSNILQYYNEKNLEGCTEGILFSKYERLLHSLQYIGELIINFKYEFDKNLNKKETKTLIKDFELVLKEFDNLLDSLDKKTTESDKKLLSLSNRESLIIKCYFELFSINKKLIYKSMYFSEKIKNEISKKLSNFREKIYLSNNVTLDVYNEIRKENSNIDNYELTEKMEYIDNNDEIPKTELEIKKEKLEIKINSDETTLDELIEIRTIMPDLYFKEWDINYVEERINSKIENLENIKEIEKIKAELKKIGLEFSICDRTIRRIKGIKPEDVEKLDKVDLEYFIYNSDNIFTLINIKKQMQKYKFSKEKYADINEYINSSIDSIYRVDELKKVKQKLTEYKFDLSYVDKAIYNLKFNIHKQSNDPLIRKLDAYIETRPMGVLEKVGEDNIKNGRDNRIIEKAISNKKKKLKEIKKLKRRIAFNKVLDTLSNIEELLSIFTSKSKKTKKHNYNLYDYSLLEQEEILNGNYEPYQFEEEELEEDDYYFEDDLDSE